QTTDDLLRELRALVGEPVEIEVIASASPHVVSTDTALYRLIERVVGEHDPAGRVVPYLTVGFTDSCNYARLGITCYGFTPLQLPPDLSFSALFHGHNERIPVDGFGWGVRTFCEVVRRFVLTDRGSKGD
ncbi:MAG: M20/M25/M40 family metallo-hydrolase, partial [Myxococcales bacterium]|nr:M20/M25/M40 family metallo-hydrolase [Myxococcales bacterium]